MSEEKRAEKADTEFETRRAGFEKILLDPHLEGELEWLRAMQATTVDAGLNQITVRNYCVLFNLVSIGLALKLLFWDSQTSEPDFLWIAAFALANIASLGVYVGVAMSLASHRIILSRINERARTIDSKRSGDMALGSAIDERI